MKISKRRLTTIGLTLILALLSIWLTTTQNNYIWPVRNTLQYYALTWWWEVVDQTDVEQTGTLQGQVLDPQGKPIAAARVLVSRWDGTTYSSRSNQTGHYRIDSIPAGRYRPVAGAPGHRSRSFGNLGGWVNIKNNGQTVADVVLGMETPRPVQGGRNLVLGEPTDQSCTRPLKSAATRRQVTFESGNQPNQLTYYYAPRTATTTSQLPILLAVYPSSADGWECASLPLAEAGYAVLAMGPAYSFDPEQYVDELERLVQFARAGNFPGSDASKIALLGGSYSGLHVLRLLQRDQSFEAAVLLGPPTDLFDMRRRLEDGTYITPYGLDRALIALGLPDRDPLRYWRYSGAYHVRADWPPLIVMHSRSDDIVPYQQSELLTATLAEVGATYETHFFDRADHYLLAEAGDADAQEIYRLTLDFLARHLQ